MGYTSTYVAFNVQSLFAGATLCNLGLIPAGAGANCIDNREGGRMPDPEGVRAE